MSRRNNHHDRAYATEAGSSFHRLAKQLGHTVDGDNWKRELLRPFKEPVERPEHEGPRFLGRLMIGSDNLIKDLSAEYQNVDFVTTDGSLAFSHMYRKIMHGRSNGERILDEIELRIIDEFSEPIDEADVVFSVREQAKSGQFAGLMQIKGEASKQLKAELEITFEMLRAERLRPASQPVAIRIAECESQAQAHSLIDAARYMIGTRINLGIPSQLTPDN